MSGDDNLLEKGFDSLMVVELLRSVERDIGLTLYPREFYERPSLKALSNYIVRELSRQSGLEHADSAVVPDSEKPAALWTHGPDLPGGTPERSPEKRLSREIVFLLSSPRAGSTLLRVMLAGHPGFFCPPELHLLPSESMAERRDKLRGSYLEEGLQRALMQLLDVSAESSRVRLEEWEA